MPVALINHSFAKDCKKLRDPPIKTSITSSTMADRDASLIQAVENARLLRRSEHRKMEAQVSTKCLMRADDRRQKEKQKRMKMEIESTAVEEIKDSAGAKQKAAKRGILGKTSHKMDRAMRRMYGDLTQEELDEAENAHHHQATKAKKKKKKIESNNETESNNEHHHHEAGANGGGDGGGSAGTTNTGHASHPSPMPQQDNAGGAATASRPKVTKMIPEKRQPVVLDEMEENTDELYDGADLEASMHGSPHKKPFGVVFKPYGGDTFGTRGKYTEGMVYQSRLTRNNKKKKGLLSAFFDPGRVKVQTPREEEEDEMREISVDLNSKQRCAATLCNLR